MQEKISFFSRLENLVFAERFIEEILVKKSLSEQVLYETQLAVSEAILNAIIHGNKLNPEKLVILQGKYEESKIIFTIIDEGKGIDNNNLCDPTSADKINEPYGRGIFIMKKLASKVTFLEKGRTVCLEFETKNC